MYHAVPALWRLHMVHHADVDFDLTTGLRFHPVEILLSMVIKLAAVAALGPPPVAVLIFEVVLNSTAVFNHGNVRLPRSVDRLLRWIVVTPDMHRVHHSVLPLETNSNFGQMFTGRWHRFGYACVAFGTPVSMRRFCRERKLWPAELAREDRFAVVGEVADELMAALSAVIPVVPVSVVATVFQKASRALTELEIKAGAQSLMADLEARGVRIHIPRQDREYSIQVGLRMLTLRHIVEENDGLFSLVPEEQSMLAYYANSIAHHLVRSPG